MDVPTASETKARLRIQPLNLLKLLQGLAELIKSEVHVTALAVTNNIVGHQPRQPAIRLERGCVPLLPFISQSKAVMSTSVIWIRFQELPEQLLGVFVFP